MPVTSFAFTAFTKRVTTNEQGEQVMYFELELTDPIERVTGSNSIYDPQSGRRVNYLATDVTMVSVSLELLSKFESEFVFGISNPTAPEDEWVFDGTGIYKGNLMLDVAKSQKVWLTDTPFSKMSGEWKKAKRGEELSSLIQRHLDKK